jgi:hypothetical protein
MAKRVLPCCQKYLRYGIGFCALEVPSSPPGASFFDCAQLATMANGWYIVSLQLEESNGDDLSWIDRPFGYAIGEKN